MITNSGGQIRARASGLDLGSHISSLAVSALETKLSSGLRASATTASHFCALGLE